MSILIENKHGNLTLLCIFVAKLLKTKTLGALCEKTQRPLRLNKNT